MFQNDREGFEDPLRLEQVGRCGVRAPQFRVSFQIPFDGRLLAPLPLPFQVDLDQLDQRRQAQGCPHGQEFAYLLRQAVLVPGLVELHEPGLQQLAVGVGQGLEFRIGC